jgi:hypothetical protein
MSYSLWYTCKRDFIHACKKSKVFTAPIFTKLTNAEQIYMQTSWTDSHPHRIINTKSGERNSFMTLPKVWHSLCWFSQNSQLLNGIMWRDPIPNSTKISQKKNVESKGINSTVVELIFMKIWHMVKLLTLGHRHWQTNGWTNMVST